MAQEFFIKSEDLEAQVRKLLPSQGGLGAGFDLSASTQIVPIIDLTESAEGSNLRSDLQSALDFSTSFTSTSNATSTLVTTTGFFRVFGVSNIGNLATGTNTIFLDDGATQKELFKDSTNDTSVNRPTTCTTFDFIVFLSAGLELKQVTNGTACILNTTTRQIASIDGTLTNPLNF